MGARARMGRLRSPANLALVGLLALSLSGCFGPFRQAWEELPSLGLSGKPDAKPLIRLAILPAAFAGADGNYPCDVCPSDVTLRGGTTAADARLVTAFFYEQIARHPRFQVLDHRLTEALAAPGMRAGMNELVARDLADVVVVPAVIEFRERIGGGANPERPAGLTLYAAVMPLSGADLAWEGRIDDDESPDGRFGGTFRRLVEGGERRWMTGGGFAALAVEELVEDMVDELD